MRACDARFDCWQPDTGLTCTTCATAALSTRRRCHTLPHSVTQPASNSILLRSHPSSRSRTCEILVGGEAHEQLERRSVVRAAATDPPHERAGPACLLQCSHLLQDHRHSGAREVKGRDVLHHFPKWAGRLY
jgi:hypothetical protein